LLKPHSHLFSSEPKQTAADFTIVDGHAHLGPREIGDEYARMGETYSAERLIQSMDANGIKMATVWAMRRPDDYTQANQYIAAAARKHPERLIAFARYNPWLSNGAERLAKAIKNEGAKGLKLHPSDDSFDPDDSIVHPLLEVAERERIPVVLHTGGNSRPSMVGLVADRFPDVNFVLLHLGGYHDYVFAAKKCENVFLETSQCLYLHRIARQVVNAVGADRVIWGSDVPYHYQEVEKRKIELAGLRKEELGQIMGGNILRLLNM